MDQQRIGKLIAVLRKEKQMTQEELAKKLGVNYRSVSRWENGHCMPDISLLQTLAAELDISVSELLNGERTDEESELKHTISLLIELSDHERTLKARTVNLYFSAALLCLLLYFLLPRHPILTPFFVILGILAELLGFYHNLLGKPIVSIQPDFFLQKEGEERMRTADEMLNFAAKHQKITLRQYRRAYETVEKLLEPDETACYTIVAESFRMADWNRMLHAVLVLTDKRLIIGGESLTGLRHVYYDMTDEFPRESIVSAEKVAYFGTLLRIRTAKDDEMEFTFKAPEAIDGFIEALNLK